MKALNEKEVSQVSGGVSLGSGVVDNATSAFFGWFLNHIN